MRDFWKYVGGIAIGILAVTGVYALDEDEKPRSIEYDEGEMDEVDDEAEEGTDDDGRLIVRPS